MLALISEREDPEASLARARIYERLRKAGRTGGMTFLAEGDRADLQVLSRGGTAQARAESAARLSRHFLERASNPSICRSHLPGSLGEPLRRAVLAAVAERFAQDASPLDLALACQRFSEEARALALESAVSEESARWWRKRALEAEARARAPGGREVASSGTRAFSGFGAIRHLEEAVLAADLGTRERADRANLDGIVDSYFISLVHYTVVRETVVDPGPSMEHMLAAQEIVVRCLLDLLTGAF